MSMFWYWLNINYSMIRHIQNMKHTGKHLHIIFLLKKNKLKKKKINQNKIKQNKTKTKTNIQKTKQNKINKQTKTKLLKKQNKNKNKTKQTPFKIEHWRRFLANRLFACLRTDGPGMNVWLCELNACFFLLV